ncbi:MAG: Flp/Fap pilin component [Firmicutes bacterium]|nr:Flp/Fap pilin component [Bacillota bacterium]
MLMIQMVRAMLRNEKGQGMVEYGLILALIAVVVVGVMTTMGSGLNGILGTVNGKLNP